MPLILISGIPCSGKSTRSLELARYFQALGKEVHVVSESEQIRKAGFEKNSFFADSNKEKHIRGLLKSEVLRLISANNVVILDASNYIKGYRYELFCGTKANKCTQCTVHTEINREEAWRYNLDRPDEDKYTRDTFDALVARYEEPESKNRWDSPLFLIFPNDELDKSSVYQALFKKKPPKPNDSTQNPPLSSTNFLYDLDQITKVIMNDLIKLKSDGGDGLINVPGHEDLQIDLGQVDVQQLLILRRQFITYCKSHVPDMKDVSKLFVQYVKTSIS